MFDIKLLDKFRDIDKKDESSIDDDVKKAWFTFNKEFCRCVSFHWTNYLKSIERKENASFKGMLTASDEALAMWLVKIKYEEAKAETDYINEFGNDAWKKSRKKHKSGTHDSKWKLDEYIELHQSIIEKRSNHESNTLWEKLFFDSHFHQSNGQDDTEIVSKGEVLTTVS